MVFRFVIRRSVVGAVCLGLLGLVPLLLSTALPVAAAPGDPGPLAGGEAEVVAPTGSLDRDVRLGLRGDELWSDPASAPVAEMVELRTAASETWSTLSGRRLVRAYGEPKFFEPTSGKGFGRLIPAWCRWRGVLAGFGTRGIRGWCCSGRAAGWS